MDKLSDQPDGRRGCDDSMNVRLPKLCAARRCRCNLPALANVPCECSLWDAALAFALLMLRRLERSRGWAR
jgi:hypothetical protein